MSVIIKRGTHTDHTGRVHEVVVGARALASSDGWAVFAEGDGDRTVGWVDKRPSHWSAVRGLPTSDPGRASVHLTLHEALQALADFAAEQAAPKPPEPPTREQILAVTDRMEVGGYLSASMLRWAATGELDGITHPVFLGAIREAVKQADQ